MQNLKPIDEYNNIENASANLYQQYGIYTEQNFIYSMLFNDINEKEIRTYMELLKLKEYGYVINIEFIEDSDNGKGFTLSSNEVSSCVKNALGGQSICLVGPVILNRLVVLISTGHDESDLLWQRNDGESNSKSLLQQFKEEYQIPVNIGIGTTKNLFDLHLSYEEALKALRYEEVSPIRHIMDIEDSTASEHINYMIAEHKLIENIKQGKYEALDMFSVILDLIKPLGLEEKKNKVIELLILSCQAARLEGNNEGSFLNYQMYFKELQTIREDMLDAWAYKKFQYIIKAVRHRKKEKVSTCIAAAIEYIDDHYREELSLDDVSRYVNISPQYLSKLFKEETNFNFVEWVTNVRITHAKELMNETDMTIKEICFLVGYNDPNYFSRIFKRIVGCSPTEYTKNKEND